jgi:hypothetical protein
MSQRVTATFNAFRVLAAGVLATVAVWFLGPSLPGALHVVDGTWIIYLALVIYVLSLLAIVLLLFRVIDIRELLRAPFGRASLVIVVIYCLIISYIVYTLRYGTDF